MKKFDKNNFLLLNGILKRGLRKKFLNYFFNGIEKIFLCTAPDGFNSL